MTTKKAAIAVTKGDVFRDKDPRMEGRHVRVVDSEFPMGRVPCRTIDTNKLTHIDAERLAKQQGWQFVAHAPYLSGKSRRAPYKAAPCPRCNDPLPVGRPGAASRYDGGRTEICSGCGRAEWMEQEQAARIAGAK